MMLQPSPTFPSIAAVTFDVGGTLLAPIPSVGEVYSEILANHGVNSDPEQLNRNFKISWKAREKEAGGSTDENREMDKWKMIVRETFGDLTTGLEFEKVFLELWETFASPRRWKLRQNARETINAIRRRGIRTAVLSNWDCRLRPLLEGFDLLHSFDALFISSEVGWEKPAPRIFAIAQDRLNLPPDKILHVGDTWASDFVPAIAAGWHSILISEDSQGTPPAIPRISELSSLVSLIQDS